MSISSAESILRTVRELTSRVDSTRPGARTIDEEIVEILSLSGVPNPDRVVRILDCVYGFTRGTPMTLEAIGEELGVTRERVRQIRNRAESDISRVLQWHDVQSLAAVRECVREQGGIATVNDVGSAVVRRVPEDRYHPELYVKWIIERAQDPGLAAVRGDIVVGPPLRTLGFKRVLEVVEGLLSTQPLLTIEAAAEGIAAHVDDLKSAYARHYAGLVLPRIAQQVMPGQFSANPWSRADWAEYVLKTDGFPLHYRAIAARVQQLTGVGFSAAGFNSILNSDKRFVRVGAGDFALTDCGVQPYSRFDEVIERYLRAAGAPVHEDQIADDLLRSYTVARSTVTAMLRMNDRYFQHFGGGYWGLVELRYLPDPMLEQQVLECLKAAGRGLSTSQIRQWLLDQTRGAMCPSTSSLELTLYLSPKIWRFGTSTPARFRTLNAPATSALSHSQQLSLIDSLPSTDSGKSVQGEDRSEVDYRSRLEAIADML